MIKPRFTQNPQAGRRFALATAKSPDTGFRIQTNRIPMIRSYCLNRAARFALSAVVVLASVATSVAAECEAAHDPAPESSLGSQIAFHNDTTYALRLYWIDYEGFLTEYGLIQPDESASFDTFVGHQWLVEAYMPDGAECLGPISANDQTGCNMRILYDAGFGYDAGMCDF
jgi:hypothetical protein